MVKWHSIDGKNRPKINKLYLVRDKQDTFGMSQILLGMFDGELWTIADEEEVFTCKDIEPAENDFYISEYAELPDFTDDLLDKPQKYVHYLISVKLKDTKRYMVYIGTYNGCYWTVGNLKSATELYQDDILDIKVIPINILI